MDPLGFGSGRPVLEFTFLVEEAKRLPGDLRSEYARPAIHDAAHEESVIAPPSGRTAAA